MPGRNKWQTEEDDEGFVTTTSGKKAKQVKSGNIYTKLGIDLVG